MRRHWKLIWRVLPYLRPHKRLAAGSVIAMVLSAIVALAEPWPLAFLIDGVLGSHSGNKQSKPVPQWITNAFGVSPYRLIVVGVVAGLAIALLINALAMLNEYVNTKLSQRMILRFRSDLVDNALRQSVAFHDARSMGDFIARINYESSSVGNITVALPPLAQSALTLGGMAYIAFRIDHGLALLALLVTPFIYYSVGFYGNRIEPRLRHVRGLEGRSINIVIEAMSMLRVIAVFNREKYEHRRFVEQATEAVAARVDVTVRQTLFSLVVNVITAFGTALVLGFGALHVLRGDLTVGQMLVVIAYVHSVYGPLQQISHSMAGLQEQFIFLAMSLELLDQVPEIDDAPGAVDLAPVRGAVTFENVQFSYGGREGTLKDISFDVAPGEAIAIVGPTGAGKTTLMGVLSRLVQPADGRVLVDGVDIRDVTLKSLREQISVVLQEPFLFSGTVADNIRYGRLDATIEEVVQAAIAANAHDFIKDLPAGYDTLLGENGTALSGGERQRICVARAFLKDAPILILDEPTSSIDSRTEAVILDSLELLMKGRTTFMIAHRLSTLRSVDRILVLDGGRLVEQGTHTELMGRQGLYRLLHEVQASHRMRYHDDEAVDASAEAEAEVPPEFAGVAEAERIRTRIGIAESVVDGMRGARAASPAELARAQMLSFAPTHSHEEHHLSVPPLPNASFSAQPNPIVVERGRTQGVTELCWTAVGCETTEVHIDGPDGPLFATAEHDPASPSEQVRTTGDWVADGMTFYLQDTSSGKALKAEHTIGKVVVRVVDPTTAAEAPDAEPESGTGTETGTVVIDAPAMATIDAASGPRSVPVVSARAEVVGRPAAVMAVRPVPGSIVVRVDYGRQLASFRHVVGRLRHEARRLTTRWRSGRRPTTPSSSDRPGQRPPGQVLLDAVRNLTASRPR